MSLIFTEPPTEHISSCHLHKIVSLETNIKVIDNLAAVNVGIFIYLLQSRTKGVGSERIIAQVDRIQPVLRPIFLSHSRLIFPPSDQEPRQEHNRYNTIYFIICPYIFTLMAGGLSTIARPSSQFTHSTNIIVSTTSKNRMRNVGSIYISTILSVFGIP
jgi:hypothetical protein